MTTDQEHTPKTGVVMRDMYLEIPFGVGTKKLKKGQLVTIIGQFFVHEHVASIPHKEYLMVLVKEDAIPIPVTIHDILIPNTM